MPTLSSGLSILGFSLAICACTDSGAGTRSLDAGFDAAGFDAQATDFGAEDAQNVIDAPALDASESDSGGSASGFGTIAGPCGRVLAELDESAPSYFLTHYDFMSDGYNDPEERTLLTEGAQEILADGTAGGSSGISEALAFEVLARCEDATFLKSETEVVYDPTTSKKTDILISIGGMRVGVSVTRAESFPLSDPYTTEDAAFIERKFNDILESSANVVESDRWVKQILFVMAYGEMHAESIHTVWESLSAETRADTILYVVVTDGDDEVIY
ncbi:MAG: hypothetical protein IPK60_22635 [Sandaracinaceae bacterium]|nr:hypothetical protein [Sandaracinaceae bacterium]